MIYGMRRLVPLILFSALACTPQTIDDPTRRGAWQRVWFSPAGSRDLAFASDVVLYASTHGLFHSIDRERFRRSALDVPGDPEVIALAAAEGVPEMYAVTDLGYLMRSKDRGRTFQMIGQFPNTRVTSMALATSGRLFIGSSDGVLISTEELADKPTRQARTYLMPWETLVLGLPIWRRAPLASDTELWSDWNPILTGRVLRMEADPKDPDHVIVDLFDDGAYQTWDDGYTWTAIAAGGARAKGPIAFGANNRVMIGTFISRDNGRTWSRAGLGPDAGDLSQRADLEFPAHSVALTPDAYWALHYRASRIYRSRGGVDWSVVGERKDFFARERETSPSKLEVDLDGTLWVATDGHGLFRFLAEK